MAERMLDSKDITEIFKNNLKIDNMVKSISSIFLNERFSKKIDYAPYFQRHYVWDSEKATYFIESIFLGTEIPPLVLFNNGNRNEVIDGRQRYETILKFLNNDLVLRGEGLKSLKSFSGKRYCDFSNEIRDEFEDTKLRILQCSVVNEPALDEYKEDKIKKEIFRRYNSGIVPLKKEEIQRAEFIYDNVTMAFSTLFGSEIELFNNACLLFLSKRQGKGQKRDKTNILLSRVRLLLTLPLIPINNYANSSSKSDDVGIYYRTKVATYDIFVLTDEFKKIINILVKIKEILYNNNDLLSESILLFECCYWIFTIMLRNFNKDFLNIDIDDFVDYIIKKEDKNSIFEPTGSHYHKAIKDRYEFISTYFINKFNLNLEGYFKNSSDFTTTINGKELQVNEIKKFKLNKPEPTSMTIEDICKDINKSRFMIRPEYQRSEVTNPIKSSYLLESIMLGMKIPPIFVYKRKDKVYEVVDGQQRLLSIIGFLGKEYLNEKNEKEISNKHKFQLKKLKILKKLNGSNIDNIDNIYVNKILDFQLDVVEIDSEINPTFESIDLFLRLNTKPYPIGENTFEMWNSHVDKDLILSIRKLSDEHSDKIFRANNTRMANEELITSLAYLDYKKRISNSTTTNVLNVYVKAGRINARIKSKSDITKILSEVTQNDISPFVESINNVILFIKKIMILIQNDYEQLNKLFDPIYGRKTGRTNQNYYLFWLILEKYTLDQLKNNQEGIFKSISNLYLLMQKYPEDQSVDDLFKKIENLNF